MNLQLLMDRLEGLEHETGCLYRTMAARLKSIDSAATELFQRLAEEEKGHEKEVRLVRDIIANAGEGLSHTAVDPAITDRMEEQLGYIREKQSLFAAGMPDIAISQAIAMALDIEEQLRERHTLEAVQIQEPRIQKLMQSLVQSDGAHVALLSGWPHGDT